jgi:hypothetical protein
MCGRPTKGGRTICFSCSQLRDRQFLEQKQQKGSPAMKKNKKLYYAGIGSRKTPDYILDLMEQLGNRLREDGMILRTGHAPGADQAFERGAGAQAQIFLPWKTFQQDVGFGASLDDGVVRYPTIFNDPSPQAFDIARAVHPAWDYLTLGAQRLHARNVHQIVGPDTALPTPVEFVLCWTEDGEKIGGTATALQLAEDRDIPIYNLANEDDYDMAFEWAWEDSDMI